MNPVPICIPTYNRPQFLLPVLEALKKCSGLTEFKIVTSEEPDCPETSKLLEDMLPKMGVNSVRCYNWERLGCAKNVEAAINRGFHFDTDIVVVVEDDVVLARDALQWMRWAARLYQDETRIMAAAAWSHQVEGYIPTTEDLSVTMLDSQFIAWGYAVTRERFQEYRWVFDESVRDKWAWDMKLTMYMPGNLCMVVHPRVSRAQNIGCEGTGVNNRKFWEDNHRVHNFVSDVWPDYPDVPYVPVTEEERAAGDRARLLNKPEGFLQLKTRGIT